MTEINLSVLNGFLDTFKKNKAEIETKMAQIDEEYRRLAEEKKKELKATMEKCQKEIEFWQDTVLTHYSNGEFSEPTSSAVADEPVFEEPEVVVDTKVDEEVVVDPIVDEEDVVLPEVEDGTTIEPSVVVEEINIPEEMENANEGEAVEEEIVEEFADAPSGITEDDWNKQLDEWVIPNR